MSPSTDYQNIILRATNWIGDAVMSLPALRAVRQRFPKARITILARPWVADLYARESFADDCISYPASRGWGDLPAKRAIANRLRKRAFDCAVLFPNSFESALTVWLAGIPERIGYARDGRGLLLTRAVPVPVKGSIPRHESYYYLELLRHAGMMGPLPPQMVIRLDGLHGLRKDGEAHFARLGLGCKVIGVSPGAAFGGAKRWFPARFAEAASMVAGERGASVAVFGSGAERPVCEQVARQTAARGILCRNLAGETSLCDIVAMTAACEAFLTNDSGSMHIASAAGVPTVAVFGATDPEGTGPTGDLACVVRKPVECSPCLLRECPIDHRCMEQVTAGEVARQALVLLK